MDDAGIAELEQLLDLARSEQVVDELIGHALRIERSKVGERARGKDDRPARLALISRSQEYPVTHAVSFDQRRHGFRVHPAQACRPHEGRIGLTDLRNGNVNPACNLPERSAFLRSWFGQRGWRSGEGGRHLSRGIGSNHDGGHGSARPRRIDESSNPGLAVRVREGRFLRCGKNHGSDRHARDASSRGRARTAVTRAFPGDLVA